MKLYVFCLLSAAAVLSCNVAATHQSRTPVPPKPLAEIPIESSLGVTFFPLRINSTGPHHVLLDTGGGGFILQPRLAEQLGFKQERAQASVSGNAALQVGYVQSVPLEIGGIAFDTRAITSSLSGLEPIFGRRLDGIIGGLLFNRYVVELDYERNLMRLYDPRDYRYNGRGTSLPISIADNIPYVNLKLTMPNDRSVTGDFLIDTGGGGMALHVYKPIIEREKLFDGSITLAETGQGIGGATQRVAARGKDLSIGPHTLSRPIVSMSQDPAGARAKAGSIGLIGMEVLRRFKVTFDYSRGAMYLEPNRSIHNPFIYDVTGMRLRTSSPDFSPAFVFSMRDNSPASVAGIRVDDVVEEIDGEPARRMTLDGLRKKLSQPDQQHKLTLLREGKRVEVTLVTKEMLK